MSLAEQTSNYNNYTLDGLDTGNFDMIYIDGVPINLEQLFNKVTDNTDNIIEGITNKFDHITTSAPIMRTVNNLTILQ